MEKTKAEPYRGPLSYGVQDRALFYGRFNDINPLRAMLLGNQISVLYAPSAAGKTSLLQTVLVPAIEAEQHTAVICRPGAKPADAVRAAVVNRLLPDPQAELTALQRLLDTLADSDEGRSLSIAKLKERYRQIKPYAPDYRELVDDIPLPSNSGLLVHGAPVDTTPVVVRFLYLKIGARILVNHLARLEFALDDGNRFWIEAAALQSGRDIQKLMEDQTIGRLLDFFSKDKLHQWYQETVNTLLNTHATLAEFFAYLIRQMTTRRIPLEIALILDQFEQFFTLFGDSGEMTRHSATNLIDYSLRRDFFKQLGDLVKTRRPSHDGIPSRLPVRLLISMRDDYIAKLDELEESVGTIEARARYHLKVLRPEDASDVIRLPAQAFGYDYEDKVFELIKEGLTEEDTKIEPGHIQIVCERLWRTYGESLHKSLIDNTRGWHQTVEVDLSKRQHKPKIKLEQFKELGELKGIMGTHFRHFLEAYDDERDRIEILDMLVPLITSRHTRNIAMKEVVLGRRFVDQGVREALLDDLRRRNIVRVETQKNGDYVEISHEFLIRAIEEETALMNRTSRYWEVLRRIFDKLEALERRGFRSVSEGLDATELRALFWYRDHLDPFEVRTWLAELQLRTSISVLSDDYEDRPCILRHWMQEVNKSPITLDADNLLKSLKQRTAKRHQLDHVELGVLAAAASNGTLDSEQKVFILESAIRNASPETTGNIAAWIGE